METSLFALKSWITSALLAVGGSTGLWVSQDQTDRAAAMLGEYVPADTVFYAGGVATPAVLAQLDYLYAQPDLELDAETIAQEIERGAGYAPLQRFGAAVVRSLFSPGSTMTDVYERLGLSLFGAHELFLDGLVPVFHFTAAPGDLFVNYWTQQGLSAGLPVSEKSIAGQAYVSIQLTPPQESDRVDLIIAQRGEVAVLSFAAPFDSAGELSQRLRIRAPEQSLRNTETLAELKRRYEFTNDFNLIMDIQRLAGALLKTEPSRMATDIEALFALIGEPDMADTLTQVCREEYSELASWTPRLVGGYTQVETSPELRLASRSVIEIQNGDALRKLNLLNGHVPQHVGDFDNQLLGLGVGVDMDQLLPVTVELWNRFTQRTFACAELRQVQQQMQQTNPALMGLVTGMAQGVKGVGLSIFDLEIGEGYAPLQKLDLLLSVATQNPALLASLAAGSPFGAYGQIPLDGSAATVDLSEIQPGLTGQISVNGQFIALSTGSRSAAAASQLKREELTPNGLMQLSLNYPAFGRLIERFPVDQLQSEVGNSDTSLCVERTWLANLLRQAPLRAGYTLGFSEYGIDTSSLFALAKPSEPSEIPPLVGRYQIFDHTYECDRGERIGIEELRADGTGSYRERDPADSCEVYALDYRWTQTGNQLLFEGLNSQGRETCAAEWENYGPYSARCELIADEAGFACLYSEDDFESLFKYRLIN